MFPVRAALDVRGEEDVPDPRHSSLLASTMPCHPSAQCRSLSPLRPPSSPSLSFVVDHHHRRSLPSSLLSTRPPLRRHLSTSLVQDLRQCHTWMARTAPFLLVCLYPPCMSIFLRDKSCWLTLITHIQPVWGDHASNLCIFLSISIRQSVEETRSMLALVRFSSPLQYDCR